MTYAKLVLYKDKVFRVFDGVLEPKYDAVFLAQHLEVRAGEAVLDLGTGSGFLAVLAASAGARVVATDIDGRACACAAANAALNGVADAVEVRQGDLFAPVAGERFDLILATPPQMPTPPWRIADCLISIPDDGGPDGRAIIDRIIAAAPEHMRPDGRLQLLQFAFLDSDRTVAALRGRGLRAAVTAELECGFGRLGGERIPYLRQLGLIARNNGEGYKLQVHIITARKDVAGCG